LGCLLFVKKMKLISVQISPFHSRLIFNSLQFFFLMDLLVIFDLTNFLFSNFNWFSEWFL